MKLTGQDSNELDNEWPTGENPMRRMWSALALMSCMLIILVMGAIATYRHVTEETPYLWQLACVAL